MKFAAIIGKQSVKKNLINTVKTGRVSHAQLFHSQTGSGALALAIAYAQYILCQNKQEDDSCGSCFSCKQIQNFSYPDLHFVYPIVKQESKPKEPVSADYLDEWKELMSSNIYFDPMQWSTQMGAEKKLASISKFESDNIVKKLLLKSYSGFEKILIMWLPEKLNGTAANKLLKLIEEPPAKTFFILVSENTEAVLQTITSRCQKTLIPSYSPTEITAHLVSELSVQESAAQVIATLSKGNLAQAIALGGDSQKYQNYSLHFRDWVRYCFKADVKSIFKWVDESSKMDRDSSKDFLLFALNSFRDALQANLGLTDGNSALFNRASFSLKDFSKYTHLANIPKILELLSEASYEIERNGNPKIIYSDVSFKLANLLRITF